MFTVVLLILIMIIVLVFGLIEVVVEDGDPRLFLFPATIFVCMLVLAQMIPNLPKG